MNSRSPQDDLVKTRVIASIGPAPEPSTGPEGLRDPGRLSWLAKKLGLDLYGEVLLTRNAALAINAGAIAILGVGVYEGLSWLFVWNATLTGRTFTFGPLTVVAAVLAFVLATMLVIVDRGIFVTETHITLERGFVGGLSRFARTTMKLLPRVALVGVAVVLTAPPLHQLAFKEMIDRHAHSEAVLEEAGRRARDILVAAEKRRLATTTTVTQSVADTRTAAEYGEAKKDRKRLQRALAEARATSEIRATALAEAAEAARVAKEKAVAAEGKAEHARDYASRLRRKVAHLPADTSEEERAEWARKARQRAARARSLEAAAGAAQEESRRASDAHERAKQDLARAKALVSVGETEVKAAREEVVQRSKRLTTLESDARTKLEREAAAGENQLDRLADWIALISRAEPFERVTEPGRADGYVFEPREPGATERDRILDDLRRGIPPTFVAPPDTKELVREVAKFVVPPMDPTSVERRQTLADDTEARFLRIFFLLALIPFIGVVIKLVLLEVLGRYYNAQLQVAAGNPDATLLMRAEEEALRRERERRRRS